MKLILYNNHSENININKNIVKIVELTGNLRESTSLINPEILVEFHPEDFNGLIVDDNKNFVIFNGIKITWDNFIYKHVLSANYAYIEEFERYYFINNITSFRNNLWIITMHVDVICSYKKQILNTYALVSRNEFLYNELLVDDTLSFQYNQTVDLLDDSKFDAQYFLDFTYKYHSSEDVPSVYDYMYNCVLCCIRSSAPTPSDLSNYKNLSAVSKFRGSYQNVTACYYLNPINTVNVINTIYNNDTLKSFVKNILILPFEHWVDTLPEDRPLIIGNETVLDHSRLMYAENGIYNRFKYATIKMPELESFTDIEPYTSYEIYLPFKGFTKINMNENAGCHITIFYEIDYESAQSSVILYNEEKELIIISETCDFAYRISLDSTNALEIQNQKNSLAVSTTISTLTSILTVVGGVIAKNPLVVAGGVLSGVNAVSSAITKNSQMYDLGATDIGSNFVSQTLYNKIYIRRIKYIKIDDSGYDKIHGKPLNEVKKLSELSGFTMTSEEHLENFGSALDVETNEIKALLKNGIIL